jgi:hypothetical protein
MNKAPYLGTSNTLYLKNLKEGKSRLSEFQISDYIYAEHKVYFKILEEALFAAL